MLNTNVTLDIYRTFSAANPYPIQGTKAAAAGVSGRLRPHVQRGRFGFQDPKIKWTHLLELEAGVDIRSAYNSWTGPSEPSGNADTVLVKDYPIVGRCSAFYVVLVQRSGRGQADEHLSVYLDRLQPRMGGCFSAGVQENCGTCTLMPAAWQLQTGADYANQGCSNCASLNNGTWTLNHVATCEWRSDTFPAICSAGIVQGVVSWHLYYQALFGWRLALENAFTSLLIFDPILAADFQCTGSNTFVNPSWVLGTCASASSATIIRA